MSNDERGGLIYNKCFKKNILNIVHLNYLYIYSKYKVFLFYFLNIPHNILTQRHVKPHIELC